MSGDHFLPIQEDFSTIAIHEAQEPEQWSCMEVVTPISTSTTYKQRGPADFKKYEYSRSGNPTREVLEKVIAKLEDAKYGYCFSSGLGANTTLLGLLKCGDHILCINDVYGGTNRLFSKVASRFGIETSFSEIEAESFEKNMRPNTKMIWIETPTNPTLQVCDIAKVAEISKKHNVILVVDNTFLTPYFEKPLTLGADVVVHSLTKYMNGHSDVVMGACMTNNEALSKEIKFLQNAMGIEAVKVLNEQVMPKFTQRVQVAVQALSSYPPKEVDENDFIDASRLVYDGVREIRRAVLMNRADEDLDPEDVELDENYTLETRSKSSAHTGEHGVDEYPDISGITTAREAMGKMPDEDKRKILQQVEFFRSEKLKFDKEVAKWDDAGNDIIVLAKHMCMIMMEMTDFTRGRGPLKTTMDVINAAKKISEAGTKLDKLTRQIAEQCPESSTKKDLLAYLQRIALYCHQMNITSKVKADVQNISGELIVSGLDSATSLIQAAKNLMNAVVLTVKASYVASTKYPRQTGTVASPIVVWKMKAPEKKPLVRPEKPEEVRAKVRKGSQKKVQNPIHALSEFQSATESI
ncbi:catenin alpha-like [Harmonia axyridis]|uniref:catenin alpha-like n=1 Tax=Harmonia axyridis TaxID=115357 RepID=UPI001E275DE6|nr:catenin alpha-like [Harmonia axyridis]